MRKKLEHEDMAVDLGLRSYRNFALPHFEVPVLGFRRDQEQQSMPPLMPAQIICRRLTRGAAKQGDSKDQLTPNHQLPVPGSPLKGPTISSVIQPP